IRGFTALFDNRDPIEALTFANTVISRLANEVESCKGTIDKFTGDGFLAHFGVIEPVENAAKLACQCALGIRKVLSTINRERHVSDQPTISIGIGINSGQVAAGVIVAGHKEEFTVLGKTVNVASRIEGLTKEFSVDCLMSSSTAELVKKDFMLQAMPERQLRGLNEKSVVHWLLPMN
ncbi:MAG: adenylate/guanylate cyclase domain-containing protein, partial [Proteobacteria bacterium]